MSSEFSSPLCKTLQPSTSQPLQTLAFAPLCVPTRHPGNLKRRKSAPRRNPRRRKRENRESEKARRRKLGGEEKARKRGGGGNEREPDSEARQKRAPIFKQRDSEKARNPPVKAAKQLSCHQHRRGETVREGVRGKKRGKKTPDPTPELSRRRLRRSTNTRLGFPRRSGRRRFRPARRCRAASRMGSGPRKFSRT